MDRQTKKHLENLDLAKRISARSKDPSTKVGALIIGPHNEPISWGYNGPPRCVADTPERLNCRDTKLAITIHAELNAILFAENYRLQGSTLYVYPFPPCAQCAAAIIQTDIAQIVSLAPSSALASRWGSSLRLASELLSEAEINVILYHEKQLERHPQ